MKEEKLMSFDNFRCPECHGVVNRVWFCWYDAMNSKACFIAECWSGDLNKHSYHHLFEILIDINGVGKFKEQCEIEEKEAADALRNKAFNLGRTAFVSHVDGKKLLGKGLETKIWVQRDIEEILADVEKKVER